MEFLKTVYDTLCSRKAFTGLMLMSILSILIGAIVLLITYLVLNAVITAVTGAFPADVANTTSASLNASMFANIGVINSALTLVGIMLIGAGALGLIYMFSGLGGGGMGSRRGQM